MHGLGEHLPARAARLVLLAMVVLLAGCASATGRSGGGWIHLLSERTLSDWRESPGPAGGHWTLRADGVLRHDGVTNDLWTVREFGDFELETEFRWPDPVHYADYPVFDADGEERRDASGKVVTERMADAGDSGIFLRGYPKAQVNLLCYPCGSGEVWDYRTDPALPREIRRQFNPSRRADRPPGEWNRLRVTLVGERLTVELNGVEVIHGAPLVGVPRRGPIGLQHEFGRVEFRRMRLRELGPGGP